MTVESDIRQALSLLQGGQSKAAVAFCKSAHSRHKGSPVFANIAGIASGSLGKQAEAIGWFLRALKRDPKFSDARRNLAQTLILTGRAQEAEKQLGILARTEPDDPVTPYMLAQALMQRGALAEAETAVSDAIRLDGTAARNLNLRALIRTQAGDPSGALDDYRAALALDPQNVDALTNVSLPLARRTLYDEALAAAERAVQLNPAHLGARLRLGAQLVELGRTAEAKAQYRTVLDIAAGHAQAMEQLALLQTTEENAPLLPQVETAAKRATGADAAHLNFALAHLYDQAGKADAAARALVAANRARARLTPYDSKLDAQLHTDLAAAFPVGAQVAATTEDSGPTPIFVLGLPRSGTSLTEAVLGAHSRIAPFGEQALSALLLRDVVTGQVPFDPAGFARAYRAQMPDLPKDATAFTDKMPENYRLIGFILTAFPEARIIHLRRDPRDVALSLWRGHFSGSALGYAYDLKAMAQRFNNYAALMAHWHAAFPGRIHDMPYETLVNDVTAASRQVADWCGVEWEPQMATPERTELPVLTLSASQLRRPVDARSVGKWQAHSGTLAPFVAGLDPALWREIQH